MKQHITTSDLDQLTEKGKERLREWWKPKKGDKAISNTEYEAFIGEREGYEDEFNIESAKYPLLSIGQMIEFLDDNFDHNGFLGDYWDISVTEKGWSILYKEGGDKIANVNLCDALWSACVEILNK